MTENSPYRASTSAVLLLLLLGLLTFNLLTISESDPATPLCGDMSALPIQPLGIEFPAFSLDAYGRSSVNLTPGDTLCLALGWTNGPGTAEDYQLHIDVQKNPDSRIGGYMGPMAGPQGWDPFFKPVEHYGIRIAGDALPGRYNLVVTILLDEEALQDPITIGTIQVVEDQNSSAPLENGDVGFEGELQVPWPFIPTAVPTEEDV